MDDQYVTNIRNTGASDKFVGRYPLGKLISEAGGFGVVYETIHPELHQKCAVKILRNDRVDGELMLQIRKEVEKMAVLREHKNIVQELDAGEDNGQYFMVMELMHGSLADWIGKIPLDQAQWAFKEAAEGLKHIHDLDYVHQDIKPSNILLRYDQNKRIREVKISDFGLAISLNPQGSSILLSGSGTIGYQAPEVLNGGSPPTKESDIYSLGVTFYEVLTGRKPTSYAKSEKPSKLRKMPKKLAKQLDPLILKMIER